MLDVLCSRLPAGKDLQAVVKMGDKVFKKTKFSYVAQQDTLLNTATVRETLETAIFLRNKDCDQAQVTARVDSVLADLGLTEKADSYVGGGEVRSLSGGERRRTSIGQEIASSNSAVICCDEPTTGLDSNTAEHVVACLRTIAQKKSMIVIATIHQPNSTITGMFDDFMLLNKGRVVYMGPFDKAVEEFNKNGCVCPLYSNPCDFFISTVANPETAAKLALAHDAHWETVSVPFMAETLASTAGVAEDADDELEPVSLLRQMTILTIRAARQTIRDPGIFTSELIQYIFIGLFLGGMYYDINLNVTQGVFDRTSSLFFVLAVLIFTPPFTAVTTFSIERHLFKKERGDKLYNLFSWLGAKTVTSWPMEMVLCLVFSSMVYFMLGFQRDAGKFFNFLLVLVLFQLCGESLGLMFAVANDSPIYAIVWMSLILIVALSLTGFLTSEMPSYYLWIQDSNVFRFALLALLINEFDGLEFTDDKGNVVAKGMAALPAGLQPKYGFGTYIAIIAAFVVGLRLLIALQLKFIDVKYMEVLGRLLGGGRAKAEPERGTDAAEVELGLIAEKASPEV